MMETIKQAKFHNGQLGTALSIKITPRMPRNEISEILSDGTIKIRLSAPPVDGQANLSLRKFLAEVFRVPQSSIEIIAGVTGRNKLVSIIGLDPEEAHNSILSLIQKK
jgi:uncharacterized protein